MCLHEGPHTVKTAVQKEMDATRDKQVRQIVNVAQQVWLDLGPDYLDSVYREEFIHALCRWGIPCDAPVTLTSVGCIASRRLEHEVEALCFNAWPIRVLACNMISPRACQSLEDTVSDLDLAGGILLNFGCSDRLEWQVTGQ